MFGGDSNKQPDESGFNERPFKLSLNWPSDDEHLPWLKSAISRGEQLVNSFNDTDWESLNENIWSLANADPNIAYRVPSAKQYSECLDKPGARSVWTEDGFWRCLFKGQKLPNNLRNEFKDYTGFLNYQRDLVKRREADANSALQTQLLTGRQDQGNHQLAKQNNWAQAPNSSGPSSKSSGWKSSKSWNSIFSSDDSGFPGSTNPRLISEEEAKGKRCISQNSSSETVSLDDGSTETRTQTTKYFSDGTALMQSTKNNTPSEPAGWFWK